MVKLGFPHTISTVKVHKDAIHIHPPLSNEDNKLHILDLIDLNNDTKLEAQIGKLVPKDALSFGGKTYYLMESSLADYNIYIESFPKHMRKNGIAAMLTNQEDVCGEAIVVRAKSKGWWWRRAKALDPTAFLKELTRLNPSLEVLPAVKPPTTKKVALSSPRKFNSTGDLLNKMGRSRS